MLWIFLQNLQLDLVLHSLDNKNVVMDLTSNAFNMSELIVFGYFNYYQWKDLYVLVNVVTQSPKCLDFFYKKCLVKAVRVVSIKQPSPN
jgi:hypothetical protein